MLLRSAAHESVGVPSFQVPQSNRKHSMRQRPASTAAGLRPPLCGNSSLAYVAGVLAASKLSQSEDWKEDLVMPEEAGMVKKLRTKINVADEGGNLISQAKTDDTDTVTPSAQKEGACIREVFQDVGPAVGEKDIKFPSFGVPMGNPDDSQVLNV